MVYASIEEPVAEADGTYAIEAGTQLCVPGGLPGGLNLLGTGKVQVVASGTAFCPFKTASKGGGNGAVATGMELDCLENEQFTAEIERKE